MTQQTKKVDDYKIKIVRSTYEHNGQTLPSFKAIETTGKLTDLRLKADVEAPKESGIITVAANKINKSSRSYYSVRQNKEIEVPVYWVSEIKKFEPMPDVDEDDNNEELPF